MRISYAECTILLPLIFLSTALFAENKPWEGAYISTKSIFPDEMLEMAKKQGESVEGSYPALYLHDNGTIETVIFGKVERQGAYTVEGRRLIVTYTNKSTNKTETDANNTFSEDYSQLTLGGGNDAWLYIKKDSPARAGIDPMAK